MKNFMGWLLVGVVGCGGSAFDGGDLSMVPDATSDGLTQVDAKGDAGIDFRADAGLVGDGAGTIEGSPDGTVGEGGEGGEGGDGDTVPTCGEEEVHPQDSPTCRQWIATTPWPLERGCCRRETRTCGHVVTFSPFCVELH